MSHDSLAGLDPEEKRALLEKMTQVPAAPSEPHKVDPQERVTELARKLCRIQEAVTGAKVGTPEWLMTEDDMVKRIRDLKKAAQGHKPGAQVVCIGPHGYVRYVDHLGSDRRIVEAARVSYGSPSKGDEADEKLLRYLFRMRHTSPFEQCNITFNIKMPIFVMRQFVRHRTFRLNEWSGRYSEMADEFFIPKEWRRQDTKNKQGSVADQTTAASEWHTRQTDRAKAVHEMAYMIYKSMLEDGVAREQARCVLPLSLYTEIYVNADLHNLLHFVRLRTDSHAQQEMQDVANAMRLIASNLFPWTFAAFDKYELKMVEKAC